MNKRRFVANIFTALATFAASAVSFNPVDNSTKFYKEGSSGELIFVGEADSANINLVSDNTESEIRNALLVSGKDTVKVTGSSVRIGTGKCYSLLYNSDDDNGNDKKSNEWITSQVVKNTLTFREKSQKALIIFRLHEERPFP